MKTAYLSLGANLGDRRDNLIRAVRLLSENRGIAVGKCSSIYRTTPIGAAGQDDYYNCALEIKTSVSPQALLKEVKNIESELGRKPDTHLQPRPIDIDILLYDTLVLDTAELTIPHMHMTERAFVLVPLLEIAPDLVYPIDRKPLRDLLTSIKPPQSVERVIDAGEIFQSAEKY